MNALPFKSIYGFEFIQEVGSKPPTFKSQEFACLLAVLCAEYTEVEEFQI